jgi:uncharacterized protein YoxC
MKLLFIIGEVAIVAIILIFNRKNRHFMSNTSQTLEAIVAQLSKAKGEIVGKIQTLTDSINNNQDTLSPESQQALSDLQTVAQQLDDIVPDAPAAPVDGGDTTVPPTDQTAA